MGDIFFVHFLECERRSLNNVRSRPSDPEHIQLHAVITRNFTTKTSKKNETSDCLSQPEVYSLQMLMIRGLCC
jgi:hypothetical protein